MFVFNGDWKFDLALPLVSKLNADHWTSSLRQSEHDKKMSNGLVPIEIRDRRDYDPDPMDHQLKTIEYIQENELLIMQSLYKSMKEIVNPAHVGYCGEDDWVRPLDSYKDLGETIKVDQIQIQLDEKDGYAYYAIMCDYIGDYEHGLVITMYQDEYLGSAGSYEVDYESIAKHRGGYTDEERQANVILHKSGEGLLHIAHEKYNKLKPWQIDVNGSYLSKLMHDDSKNDEVIAYIERGELDINIPINSYWGEGLIELADHAKNDFLLNYLLDNGAEVGRLFLKYANDRFDSEKLDYFLSKGADIDAYNFYGRTTLYEDINQYCSAHIRTYTVRDKASKVQFKEKMKKRKAQIRYLIEKGANPESCNVEGEDYRTILTRTWGSYKDDYNSIDEVDKIIYGAPKKSKGIWEKFKSFWN